MSPYRNQRRDNFDEQYEWGVALEQPVANYLVGTGRAVTRVRHDGAVAPSLMTWSGKVTLPDLQATRFGGSSCWVDVKRKTTTGHLRILDTRTNGIDVDAFCEYRRVQEVTGFPVFIFFGTEDEGDVRFTHIDRPPLPSFGDGDGMHNWDHHSLPVLCSLDDVWKAPAAILSSRPLFEPSPTNIQGSLFDGS